MTDPGHSQQTIFDPAFGVERAPAAEVDARLLREQFVRLRESRFTPLIPLLLLAGAHFGSVPLLQLLLWCALMLVAVYIRRANALRMLEQPESDRDNVHRHFLTEWACSVMVALGWASCMWLLGTGGVDGLFYFRLVFLAGVCAVALGVSGLQPRVYGSFLTTMLLAALAYLALEMPVFLMRNPLFVVLALMFFSLLMYRSRDESRRTREWIEARMNQAQLVQRLRDVVIEQHSIRMSLEAKSADLERSNQLLNELAIHDALTGAYNRGHVQELLRQSVARYKRYRQPLCVMLIDIDHFKRVNDLRGHAVGDEVLRQLAIKAGACLREGDVFGRWGGEEFIGLLPNIDLKGAVDVAERLRLGIAELRFPAQLQSFFGVTVSVGVAQILDHEAVESLVARADAALYAAKDAGRNCVVLANELVRPVSLAA